MAKKEDIKARVHKKVEDLIDMVDKVGNIDFFEFGVRHTNGELVISLKNTYKEKIE